MTLSKINHNPDVLSCLANLSNDEVFTPPEIANKMLDLLPKEIWSNPYVTFLDPCCKSGVFLREIVKRLNIGLSSVIPDEQERIDHICKKQVFGIAVTELTAMISRRSVYCTKKSGGQYSICTDFDTDDGNIKYQDMKHEWRNGKCVFCGASKDAYDRGETLESYAYPFIHLKDSREVFEMKFDVIVGNPPYQLNDGGNKASAIPLYHKFVEQAKKLNPRYLTMIIPARWYSGGKGLDSFRGEMLNDTRIRKLVDYDDSNLCFSGVVIAGGVCYFLWDRDNRGPCHVTNITNGDMVETTRFLNHNGIFIRHGQAMPIVEKIESSCTEFMSSRVSSRKPFGLSTLVKPSEFGDIKLRYIGGIGPFNRRDVLAKREWIDKWKVILTRLSDSAGRPDKEGKRKVFSSLEILPPGYVCTETYLVVDAVESEKEAINLRKYMQTKFVRFMVSQLAITQQISKITFALVPLVDFYQEWNDEKLFEKYGLTVEERTYIDSMIRDMKTEVSNEK